MRQVEIDLSESIDLGRLAFLPTPRGSFESGSSTWYGEVEQGAFYVVPAPSMGEPAEGGMTFQTDALGRGAWAWPTDRDFTPDARGGVARKAGTTTEWLRGRDEGVEQGWTFEEEPAGDGDLVVRVSASDAEFITADDRGLLFAGDAGNIVYGHGTWIDGSGERTPVPASWKRGAIELVVPASLLEDSAYPAMLDPVIGPELQTDPGVVGPDDSVLSEAPGVACTATMCMGFWNDSTGMRRIRFTPDGSFVDPVPVQHVTDATANLGGVAAMTDRFILVWGTGFTTPTQRTIYAQVFGEDGLPIAPAQTLAGPGSISNGVTACAPDRCVVVWSQAGTLSKRVDASGMVLDPFGTLVGPHANGHKVVFDGTNFVISIVNGVKRLTPSGVPLEADPIAVFAADSYVYGLASDGTGTLAAGPNQVRRVNPDGSLGSLVSTGQTFYSLGWTGASYLGVVQQSPPIGAVIGQRLDATGALLGGNIPYGVLGWSAGVVVSRPGGSLVTGRDNFDAKVLPVDADGVPGSAFALNRGTNPQRSPAVIAGQGQYLVAWADRRLGTGAVYGQRYSPTGVPIDPVPVVLFSMPNPSVARLVAGAFDGSNYLVAGHGTQGDSTRPLQAARIPLNGPPLDGPQGITLLTNSVLIDRLAVSWDGTTFAVTHLANLGGFPQYLRVQRVTPAGLLLDSTGIAVVNNAFAYPALAASADSLSHVIVWRGQDQILRFRRFTSGGTFAGAETLVGSAAAAPVGVACTPATCLMYGGNLLRTVGGTTVPIPPGGPGGPLHSAGLTVGGSEFLLTRGGLDMFGVRLSTAAVPAAIGTWFNISQSPGEDEVATSAAALGDGSALAAYERNVPAENANRVFLRGIVLASPNGGACTLAADCTSGNCVDGVCCDTTCGGGVADCQACSVATGASTDGTCGPVGAGAECRASTGVCDVAEACDGVALVCPADGFASAATECRAASDVCDVAETCTGASATCPANGFAAATTECRAASDVCDVAETCTGASATCPADGFASAATQCRAASDVCDAVENCSGAAAACPADVAAPSTTVCRPANGDCDAADTCDGTSMACPADGFAPATVVCRDAAGDCDAEETCTGASADCPSDEVAPAGTMCREADGDCDVDDFCDGTSMACADEGAPAETPCGPAPDGDCDLQNTCEGGPGNTNSCQDWVSSEVVTCREAAGPCDVEEKCDLTYDCPSDDFATDVVCREAAGECDVADSCDGTSAECPADALAEEGTACGDGVCESGECVPDGAGGNGSSSSGGDDGDGESGGDGCSCSTPSESRSAALWPLSLAMLGVLARRRRARRADAGRARG